MQSSRYILQYRGDYITEYRKYKLRFHHGLIAEMILYITMYNALIF